MRHSADLLLVDDCGYIPRVDDCRLLVGDLVIGGVRSVLLPSALCDTGLHTGLALQCFIRPRKWVWMSCRDTYVDDCLVNLCGRLEFSKYGIRGQNGVDVAYMAVFLVRQKYGRVGRYNAMEIQYVSLSSLMHWNKQTTPNIAKTTKSHIPEQTNRRMGIKDADEPLDP